MRTLLIIVSLLLPAPAALAGVAFVENFQDGELLNDPTWIPDGSSECLPDPWEHWFVVDGRLRGEGCPMDRPHRGAIETRDHDCLITEGSWEFTGRIIQNGELQVFFAWGSGGPGWLLTIANDPSPPSFGWLNHRAICLRNQRNQATDVICTPFVPELDQDYHVRVTRSAGGSWELFVDDVFIGSATDPGFPTVQEQVVIYQDKTPIEVDDVIFEDFTGSCDRFVTLDALAQVDPDVFRWTVGTSEPEEPEDQYLSAVIELPTGHDPADVDPATVSLSDADGVLAFAERVEFVAERLVAIFPLDLAAASRIVGIAASEVEVDLSSRLVHVRVAEEPASVVDLRVLKVSGVLFSGDSFHGEDTVRTESAD